MKQRALADLTASAIGFGSLGLTGGYGAITRDEATATIRSALDAGVTLLDTADFYQAGAIEALIGDAIAGRKDEAVIATRGGGLCTPDGKPSGLDGSPEHLRRACEKSLKRLGVDRIDLYYLARVDPKVPVEDSVGALAELRKAGKIAHIGLSEASADQLRRAASVHPIAALASEYSLTERGVEEEILPVARELGVGFVANSPLGRGLLGGELTSAEQLPQGDYRRNHPRLSAENLPVNLRLVDRVRALAAERGVSCAQLVLAWLLGQGNDIVPIPGSRTRAHVELNAAATELTLGAAELRALSEAIPPGATAGNRAPRRR